MSMIITDQHREQFNDDGYFIVEDVIPAEHLNILRSACAYLMAVMHQEMDRLGNDHIHISHRGHRYHIAKQYKQAPRLSEYVFSNLMADVCRATIGDTAFLFYDQYVVKSAERGIRFAWHQDGGYLGFPHRPYVTVWAAVDDMTVENGTAHIMPFSDIGIRTLVEHVQETTTGDKVGYFGNQSGIPAIVPAGSIVVFSSLTFHCSGANTTDQMRRAYVTQYSSEPICKPDSHEPLHLAISFLKNGHLVNPPT